MATAIEAEVEDPKEKALKDIYYNGEDPGSYGRLEKLFHKVKRAGVQNVT